MAFPGTEKAPLTVRPGVWFKLHACVTFGLGLIVVPIAVVVLYSNHPVVATLSYVLPLLVVSTRAVFAKVTISSTGVRVRNPLWSASISWDRLLHIGSRRLLFSKGGESTLIFVYRTKRARPNIKLMMSPLALASTDGHREREWLALLESVFPGDLLEVLPRRRRGTGAHS